MISKVIATIYLILLSSNALAATQEKVDVTTIILLFILAQALSIVGIVTMGIKKGKKKKELAAKELEKK